MKQLGKSEQKGPQRQVKRTMQTACGGRRVLRYPCLVLSHSAAVQEKFPLQQPYFPLLHQRLLFLLVVTFFAPRGHLLLLQSSASRLLLLLRLLLSRFDLAEVLAADPAV